MQKPSKWIRAISIVLVLGITSIPGYSSWNKIAQFPTTNSNYVPIVNASFFFDEQHGIIGIDGFNGIKLTTDGGTTWTSCTIPSGYIGAVNDVFMADALNGWACIEDDTRNFGLWHTTDGGLNWSVDSAFKSTATGVYQTGSTLIVSDRYLSKNLYVSYDGGQTFNLAGTDRYTGIAFADPFHGVVTAYQTGVGSSYAASLYTSDGGLTWSKSTGLLTEAWSAYAMRGTSNFLVVGERLSTDPSAGSTCHRSTDYGRTWKSYAPLNVRTTGHIAGVGKIVYVQTWTKIQFPNPTSGLLRSTNGGLTWDAVGGPSNFRDTRFSVLGCRGNIVYAFDESGGVWKTTDGGDGRLADSNQYRLSIDSPDTLAAPPCLGDTAIVAFGLLSCDSLRIDAIEFLDSSATVVKDRAVRLLDVPSTPLQLSVGSDSVRLAWDPEAVGTLPLVTSVRLRVRGHFLGSSRTIDTSVVVVLRSPGLQPAGVPDTLRFGSVLEGKTKCIDLTLHNTSDAADGPVRVQLIQYSPLDTIIQFSFSKPSPPGQVFPGDSIVLTFCFTPHDSATHTVMYSIRDNCYHNEIFVLTGQGVSMAGVSEDAQQADLVLTPNPASDRLSVVVPAQSAADVALEVSDVLGRVVLHQPIERSDVALPILLDIHSLLPGKYWVRVGDRTRSFVKQ